LASIAGALIVPALTAIFYALDHDPEKLALGLDPRVDTGFPKKSYSTK
jgi:hypothetical protein